MEELLQNIDAGSWTNTAETPSGPSARIWLVLPAFNEEARLLPALADYCATLRSWDRIVVVVNGSSDGTEALARDLAHTDSRVHVLVDDRQIGKGGALALGLRHVSRNADAADIAGYADADGALPGFEVLRLASELREGELVIGSRWTEQSLQVVRQPLARRAAGRLFNSYVRRAVDVDLADTQCAAKLLYVSDLREVVERLTLSGFAFDLDLILAADERGLELRERSVTWEDKPGSSVRLVNGVEMVADVRRLKKKYRPRPDAASLDKLTLQGTLTAAGVESTAPTRVLSAGQLVVLALGLVAIAVALVLAPLGLVLVVNGFLIVVFTTANVMKLGLMRLAHRHPCTIEIDATGPDRIPDSELPIYTVLLPMYREAAVLTQLVNGVSQFDYPTDKLDVKLLLEEDDVETRAAVAALDLPSSFEVLVIPNDGPAGKPRACNYGLARAQGEYLVIYDAEDRPEPDQLRKAVGAFRRAPSELVCVQSKLNYFNRTHNALTRLFTAEYSTLFDHVLPGLQSIGVAIPLGGTSNHFVTSRLLELGGWNAYNVTEDADLGIRIYLKGWKTAILGSTTYEEANSRYGNWIRQRSRWVKGYMQTYLFHMRHPIALERRMGLKSFAVFQFFFGVGTLCLLLAPFYWLLMIVWFATQAPAIESAFPTPLLYVGTFGLVLGTAAVTLAAISGCFYRGHYDDVKWALLSPVYMLLMSVGAWKGFIQLLYKPMYWEKTVHGFQLEAET